MERWKELLKQDIEAVARGWQEVGKDASRLLAVVERIAAATRPELIHLLNDARVEYFAGKLGMGAYDKMVEAELADQQKAEQAEQPTEAE